MTAVVFWLWTCHTGRRAGLYGPDDVARMARSVSRNLTVAHEIVCITDRPPHEFPSDVRVVPLWTDHRDLGGCYTRLKAFHPSMAEIIAPRFVWMDIDAVVTGNLDPIVSRAEDAVFWRSCTVPSLPYNGSMILMTAGARAQVWKTFKGRESVEITRAKKMIGTDQAWIAEVLGPNEAVWTAQRDGVCAYRKDAVNFLPDHARLVFFPGADKPQRDRTRYKSPWIARYLEGAGKWPRHTTKLDRRLEMAGACGYQIRNKRLVA